MKQYFLGFFTAVCLTSSLFIFIGSSNRNLGDITVSSISIYPNKNGDGGYIKHIMMKVIKLHTWVQVKMELELLVYIIQ